MALAEYIIHVYLDRYTIVLGANTIIDKWLSEIKRKKHSYKFTIIDISEKTKITDNITDYLALSLLSHFRDLEHLKRMFKCEPRSKLKKYIRNNIFPSIDSSLDLKLRRINYNVRQGDWGEVLTTSIALDIRNVNAPVKKLRYKMNKEKSLFGIDVLAFEEDGDKNLVKAILFESKTRRTYKKEIGVEAYNSLCKNSEKAFIDMLNFLSTLFFDKGNFELADKYDELVKNPNSIIKEYHSFIIMEKNVWREAILDCLDNETVDFENVYFNIFLIDNLKDMVAETYRRTENIAIEVVYEK